MNIRIQERRPTAGSRRPPLRLFAADEAPPPAPPDVHVGLTLREFFAAAVWPYLTGERKLKPRTRSAYLEALTHWESFTCNPPLAAVTKADLVRFRDGLLALPGKKRATLAAVTALKHCRAIRAILAHAGPPDSKHDEALALLDQVPRARMPSVPRARPHGVTTLDELSRCLLAADRMQWDKRRRRDTKRPLPHYSAAQFWCALLVFVYFSAFRIGTVLALTWRNVDDQGGVWVDGAITKTHTEDWKVIPDWARPLLEALRPRDCAPHGPVFAWPYHLCTLYAHFRRLQALAEIPPERRRWMKFHGLRKLHATKADELGGLLAQISLGHTTARTTAEHYTDHAAQMRRLATMLPAPRAALAREDGRQLRLFD